MSPPWRYFACYSRFIGQAGAIGHAPGDEPQRARSDGRRSGRSTNISYKTTNKNLQTFSWEDFHEARADRIAAVDSVAGLGSKDSAEHQFRLRAQSAEAAAQHVFR
jgi:hypothetical protein